MAGLTTFVEHELALSREATDPKDAFSYLERAHILSQYSTGDHVRVHLAMLKWAAEQRDFRELAGQVVRIIGAATKTAIGFIPSGNTGGTSVSAFKSMAIPADLAELIARHRG